MFCNLLIVDGYNIINSWVDLKKIKNSSLERARNKLIEHNYNPNGMALQIDPRIFSLVTTDSLLEVWIHTEDKQRAYVVEVDYYEDYYKLENIIMTILSNMV